MHGSVGSSARSVSKVAWTPELVCQLTIAAFRVLPSWPIFSRRFGEFGQGRLPIGPEKVLSWAERYLERLPRGRTVLFKWASVTASNFRDPDDTLRGFAAEIGMSWSAFQRTRRRACEIIAKGLALDGVSTFHL